MLLAYFKGQIYDLEEHYDSVDSLLEYLGYSNVWCLRHLVAVFEVGYEVTVVEDKGDWNTPTWTEVTLRDVWAVHQSGPDDKEPNWFWYVEDNVDYQRGV